MLTIAPYFLGLGLEYQDKNPDIFSQIEYTNLNIFNKHVMHIHRPMFNEATSIHP